MSAPIFTLSDAMVERARPLRAYQRSNAPFSNDCAPETLALLQLALANVPDHGAISARTPIPAGHTTHRSGIPPESNFSPEWSYDRPVISRAVSALHKLMSAAIATPAYTTILDAIIATTPRPERLLGPCSLQSGQRTVSQPLPYSAPEPAYDLAQTVQPFTGSPDSEDNIVGPSPPRAPAPATTLSGPPQPASPALMPVLGPSVSGPTTPDDRTAKTSPPVPPTTLAMPPPSAHSSPSFPGPLEILDIPLPRVSPLTLTAAGTSLSPIGTGPHRTSPAQAQPVCSSLSFSWEPSRIAQWQRTCAALHKQRERPALTATFSSIASPPPPARTSSALITPPRLSPPPQPGPLLSPASRLHPQTGPGHLRCRLIPEVASRFDAGPPDGVRFSTNHGPASPFSLVFRCTTAVCHDRPYA